LATFRNTVACRFVKVEVILYVSICGGFNKTLCLIGFARTMDGHCQRKCQ